MTPEVGMKCTNLEFGSASNARWGKERQLTKWYATIVAVSTSGRQFSYASDLLREVEPDIYRWVPCPVDHHDYHEIEVTLRKNGQWLHKGIPTNEAVGYLAIGEHIP